MLNASRRANPLPQEGIGSWAAIVGVLATFGVLVNTGVASFVASGSLDYSLESLVIILKFGKICQNKVSSISY